jgi:uncharacterized membrane protein/uncharacterized RDD family membrane protein YckC
MVDPAQLSFDVAGNLASLAIPGGLWALLYLLAWDHGAFADSIGLGRKSFWLLLPGALLASFALLPIAPVSYDWIAVSASGALFPLLVGGFAFRRYATPARASLLLLAALLVGESAVMLVIVLPSVTAALPAFVARASAQSRPIPFIVLVAAVFTAAAAVLLARAGAAAGHRRAVFVFGLATGVAVLTYAGSSAVPGTGIVESFPYYLLPPFFAGIAGGLLAPRAFPGEEGYALPASYLAGTAGVLLGADLLRQPPLYGHGAAGLYAIGGAGVLDLVYLSGLLALAGAYLVHVGTGRGWAPLGSGPTSPASTPIGELRGARREALEGRVERSVRASALAARSAATQARRLAGLPEPPDDRPWEGLPVPGWVVSDQANLDSVANAGLTDPREGFRAWLTSRALVVLGRQFSLSRFASIPQRIGAFAIDLGVVTAPAVLLFVAIVLVTPGGFDGALSSLAFNAAIYGFITVGFLYFALAEALTGATVGKLALGLAVRNRQMEEPGGLSALVRNVSLVPILTILSISAAIAVAFALRGSPTSASSFAGIALPVGLVAVLGITLFLLASLAFLGAFGVVAIALTWERQRVGDLWAGTWVVRRPTPRPPATPRHPPAGPSG